MKEPLHTDQKKTYSPRAKSMALLGVVLSLIYLLNPGAGFIEFIPDNIPIIGNLDEVTVTAILIACLAVLGIRLPGLKEHN